MRYREFINEDIEKNNQVSDNIHPQQNDDSEPVTIHSPSIATEPETWDDKTQTAIFAPNGTAPSSINGISFLPWHGPSSIEGWKKIDGQTNLNEQPIDAGHKNIGAGTVIIESDGRVWLTQPTNGFGGYSYTFPKGTADAGMSLQANAIRETWEETGLKVKIISVIGDFSRSTSVARYYLAKRISGTPVNMGWESQAVCLVPLRNTKDLLNRAIDHSIIDSAFGGVR